MLAGWLTMTLAWAGRAPEPVWVPVGDPAEGTALCVSAVPASGRLRGRDAGPWRTEAEALARGEARPARPAVRPHAAWEMLDAVEPVDAPAIKRLAEAHPLDPCLATSAAVVAFAEGDQGTARRFAGRAWVGGASPVLAFVLGSLAFEEGDIDRTAALVDKGIAMDGEHAGLRRLRAAVALQRGDVVDEDLAWLRARGDTSLDPYLLPVRYAAGRMDDYLRIAASIGAPLGPAADAIATADRPMVGLREALGITSPDQRLLATIVTSEGDIPCTLFVDDAPVTVAQFVGLATGTQAWTDPRTGVAGEGPLYRELSFHRVIPGFMVQTGDPLGTGSGGPGYRFHDEIRPFLRFDQVGRLAMANAGPETNGSQFFVTDGPAQHLDGRHTIFGQCAASDVVARIAGVSRDRMDRPLQEVRLHRVDIEVVGGGEDRGSP